MMVWKIVIIWLLDTIIEPCCFHVMIDWKHGLYLVHSILITLKFVDSRRGRSLQWYTTLGNLVRLWEALHITCPCLFCYIWWNRFGEFSCKVSEWCSNSGGSVLAFAFYSICCIVNHALNLPISFTYYLL